MKKIIKTIAVSAAVLTLFATNAVAKKADKAEKTKTEKTAKAKKEKPAKADKSKKDKSEKGDAKNLIKDMLDEDMRLYWDGDYQKAGKGFVETYGKMQETTSELTGGKAIAAALAGENSIKYCGAEYERYLDWSMRLATALGNKQNDVANGIMKDYIGTFMDEIQALRAMNAELDKGSEGALESEDFKKAEEFLKNPQVGPIKLPGINLGISEMKKGLPAKSDKKYDGSKFFNYLGTLAYAVNGDFDHAADFAKLNKVGNVNDAVKVPAGNGRLEVVALSGTIGKRADSAANSEANKVSFDIPEVGSVTLLTKVAYPTFNSDEQNHAIKTVRISLSNGTSANAVEVENFDDAVKIDVDQKAYGAARRSVFRNVVKNVASIGVIFGAAEGVKKASGNPVAGKVAQKAFDAAVSKAAEAVVGLEKADVRQGERFPHKASAAGFSVAPGTYTVTVEYLGDSGVVDTKTIENVVVEEGKVNVAVSSCEK